MEVQACNPMTLGGNEQAFKVLLEYMILSPKTNKPKAKRPQRSVYAHRENITGVQRVGRWGEGEGKEREGEGRGVK